MLLPFSLNPLKILFGGANLIKTSSINPTCFGRHIEIANLSRNLERKNVYI